MIWLISFLAAFPPPLVSGKWGSQIGEADLSKEALFTQQMAQKRKTILVMAESGLSTKGTVGHKGVLLAYK